MITLLIMSNNAQMWESFEFYVFSKFDDHSSFWPGVISKSRDHVNMVSLHGKLVSNVTAPQVVAAHQIWWTRTTCLLSIIIFSNSFDFTMIISSKPEVSF